MLINFVKQMKPVALHVKYAFFSIVTGAPVRSRHTKGTINIVNELMFCGTAICNHGFVSAQEIREVV